MSWLGLRHKRTERLYSDEWNLVVDGLDILYGYVGALKSDLEKLDEKVEAYYLDCKDEIANVSTNVEQYYLEIKSELGDIETIVNQLKSDVAGIKTDVRQYYLEIKDELKTISVAPNVEKYYLEIKDELGTIDAKLDQLKSDVDGMAGDIHEIYLMKIPRLLASVINQSVSEGADVFSPDVEVDRNGRVRFKLWLSVIGYVATKWIPAGTVEEIVGYLNARNPIPEASWHEFDFTVMKNDKINVRIYPGMTVTVFVYGLGEA